MECVDNVVALDRQGAEIADGERENGKTENRRRKTKV
jgi:hypothetical protein